MRYSLLDILACPVTGEDLALAAVTEREAPIPEVYISPATRVSAPGAAIGPLGRHVYATDFFRMLARHATPAGDPARNFSHEITEGILVATGSGRWYPIRNGVPQLYPDSIRDFATDAAFLATLKPKIPAAIFERLRIIDNAARPIESGDHYKNSEILLLGKVADPQSYLGPGYSAPFNCGAFEHSADAIRGFAISLPYLGIARGDFVLDCGSGYSWTTEWLQKMGINAVGIDINRTYLEVGRHRMGSLPPHLVVCDAEHLPFRPNVFRAVLGFNAFNHVPDRRRAMREFARTLRPRGRVVLVEPGTAHNDKCPATGGTGEFGTLQVGMSLEDVQSYVAGIAGFALPQEHFIMPMVSAKPKVVAPHREFIGWSLFTIDHDRTEIELPILRTDLEEVFSSCY